MSHRYKPRCEATTTKGKRCPERADGAGTKFCEAHHRLHFGEPKRYLPSGAVAGRIGYLGGHGHLNR